MKRLGSSWTVKHWMRVSICVGREEFAPVFNVLPRGSTAARVCAGFSVVEARRNGVKRIRFDDHQGHYDRVLRRALVVVMS